ncbi:MAG: hypothetical protein IH984_16295 [Planctomycetes bacterium]|nr:hypothetical protein [Planctomycetota bacterium]
MIGKIDLHICGFKIVRAVKRSYRKLRQDCSVVRPGSSATYKPLCLQVIRAGHIDGELTLKERKQFLFYNSSQRAVSVNLVGRPPTEQLLFDKGKFVAVDILEGQFTALW